MSCSSPGPISSTTSFTVMCAWLRCRSATLGSTRKCCPSPFLARTPRDDNTCRGSAEATVRGTAAGRFMFVPCVPAWPADDSGSRATLSLIPDRGMPTRGRGGPRVSFPDGGKPPVLDRRAHHRGPRPRPRDPHGVSAVHRREEARPAPLRLLRAHGLRRQRLSSCACPGTLPPWDLSRVQEGMSAPLLGGQTGRVAGG